MSSIKNTCWSVLSKLLSTGTFPNKVHRLLLTGLSGTGKSNAVKLLTNDFESTTLFPTQFPDYVIASTQIINGDTKVVLGPIANAASTGRPVVVEEIDQFSPDVRTILHSVADDMGQARITLPDGTYITPKPGFAVIATTNANPSVIPEALLSRFDVILNVNEPAQGIVDHLTGELGQGFANWVLNSYRDKQADANSWSYTPAFPAHPRHGITLARLIAGGIEKDLALEIVYGKAAPAVGAVLAIA